ncbi:MAG: hypothetical protein CL778_00940 [Chloroflexi bacterium]|nr:hypothetical protein [Chloroflexota bacterium]
MIISIIIIFLGLLGSAFISATEVAFVGSRIYRIRHLADNGDRNAKAVLSILEKHDKLFGTLLLVGNLFNIMVASVGTSLAITTIGNGQPNVFSTVIATAISTILVVIVGELTPKALVVSIAEKWSLKTAKIILFIMLITRPIVWTLVLFPRGIEKLFKNKKNDSQPMVTTGELRTLIDLGEQEGTVKESQGEMLEKIFRFGESEVRDVMTPRNEIIWIRSNTKLSEFLEIYKKFPQTRFPVYDNDFDDVVGILSIKDVLDRLRQKNGNKDPNVTRLVRKALFVPETKRLDHLFKEMQEQGQRLALAIDEFGGISGLITYTRLIEQIVGRTGEEGKKPDKMYITINENTYIADGGMSIVEANDEMNLEIPEGEYETVAGFFLDQSQVVPTVGTKVRVNNLRMEIAEMQVHKITKVRIGKIIQILEMSSTSE